MGTDDRENDEIIDDYNELDHEPIDKFLVPYTDEEKVDPRHRTELSEEEKARFLPTDIDNEDHDPIDNEATVLIDETQNIINEIPPRTPADEDDLAAPDIVEEEPPLRRSRRGAERHDYAKVHRKGLNSIYCLLH